MNRIHGDRDGANPVPTACVYTQIKAVRDKYLSEAVDFARLTVMDSDVDLRIPSQTAVHPPQSEVRGKFYY